MTADVLHIVTLLSADGRYGGPQTVACTLAERYGHEVWGAATAADLRVTAGPGQRRFRAIGPRRGISMLAAPGLWWALWRRLTRTGAVVHLHTGPELVGIGALLVLILQRATFVAQPHGMFLYPVGSPRARFVRRVLVPMIRRGCAVVALTQAEQTLLVSYGIPADLITIVPNGVDVSSVAARRTARGDRPCAAFVGRLHERKHPERFTAAAALLSEDGVDARFVVAGADQGAEAVARDSAPPGVVEFLGAVEPAAARRVIADAHVLVLCSDDEPFGIVAIEALASGTALLVTDTCDLAADLAAQGAALMTTAGARAIADGLRLLLTDEPAREAFIAAGRAVFRREYDMNMIDSRWYDIYRRAAAKPI